MKSMPVVEDVQDRTEEIYCKAAQIFHDHGYDATSMYDLAKALDITKARLYYCSACRTLDQVTKPYFGGLLNCPTRG